MDFSFSAFDGASRSTAITNNSARGFCSGFGLVAALVCLSAEGSHNG